MPTAHLINAVVSAALAVGGSQHVPAVREGGPRHEADLNFKGQLEERWQLAGSVALIDWIDRPRVVEYVHKI